MLLQRLADQVDGDIDQLASRIAAVRTLCFIAQRGDWIEGGAGWTERTQDKPFLIGEPFDRDGWTWTYCEFSREVDAVGLA